MTYLITIAHFDLDLNHGICDGILTLSQNALQVKTNEDHIEMIALNTYSEAVIRTYSGCGTLELLPIQAAADHADSTLLCRFSMSKVNEIGEFAKVLNHYFETSEITEIPKEAIRVCPHCGRAYAKGMDVCLFCVDRRYLFKRTLGIMRPYWKKFLIASLFVLIAAAGTAFIPMLNSRLVDKYFQPDPGMGLDAVLSGITFTVLSIAALQLLTQVFRIISGRMANVVSSEMANDLRVQIYDKIQRLSLRSVSQKTTGDLIKRVTKDTDVVRSFITEQGIYAVEKILMFIAVFVILMTISPLLTLLVLLPIPIVVFIISRFWHTIHLRYMKQWRSESRVSSFLHDIVSGIRVIKTFGTEEREVSRFDALNCRLRDISASNERFWAYIMPYLMFITGIGEFLVIYFGGKLVIDNKMTMGELLAFTLFLAYLYQPLRWMSSLPRRLGEFTTSLLKMFEIIDEKEPEDAQILNAAPFTPGDLKMEHVYFGYKPYENVLKDISLTVKQGEMIGLVGHSGAGKSTLINLILRLYEPDAGRIMLNDTDIRDIRQTDYRARTAVVFQETFLFAGTVYDNIAYAKTEASPSQIFAAAKAANAHDFIMKLPDGYQTIIGEKGHNLSGGERQRVAIARAVLRDPDILILDEATSALDPETETAIQDALKKLVKGRTTFAIAHRLATLKNANRLVVIDNGRIAETGTHESLLKLNGIYAKLVNAQRQTAKLHNDPNPKTIRQVQ